MGLQGELVAALAAALVLLLGSALVLVRARRLRPQPPRTAYRRVAVVFNPSKFADAPAVAAQVRRLLEAHRPGRVDWYETTVESPGSAQVRTAVAAGADLVVAVGGDGTVMACASALATTEVPLAVLPSGTGNLLARNLAIPLPLPAAVALALTGPVRRLDVGEVAGHRFTVMAGMGFDAAMVRDAPARAKARLGPLAYVVSGLRNLRGGGVRFDVVLDEGMPTERDLSVRGRAVLVGNLGTITGGLRLMPDAQADDGLFSVVVLAPTGLLGWARVAGRVLTRRGDSGPVLVRASARTVRVRASRPQAWQVDGDAFAPVDELEFRVLPQALRLVAPAVRMPGARTSAAA